MLLCFKRLTADAEPPKYHHDGDAGYDVSSTESLTLTDHVITRVHTGIIVWVEPNMTPYRRYWLEVRDKSGMALKGFRVHGGIVDAGYRGELVVMMSHENGSIERGQRIAQIIPRELLSGDPFEEIQATPASTARGMGGWGSTGR